MGPTQIFWITGTFMVIASSVALFLRLHEDMGENPELSRTSSLISDTVLGFRAVAKVPVVLVLLISIMGLALIYLPTEMVVLPAHFNALGDPTSLGIIISTMAGASVFGALGFELLDRWLGKRRLFRAAIIAIGVSMLPMALLPDLWLFLACGAVLGLAWGPLMPMLNTVIQTEIDPAMRGRVFAIEMTIWNAAPLISMVLVGLAVDALGVALVYLVLSGLVLLGAAVVTGMPATRSLPGPIRIPVSAGR
jgi:MFS family permease